MSEYNRSLTLVSSYWKARELEKKDESLAGIRYYKSNPLQETINKILRSLQGFSDPTLIAVCVESFLSGHCEYYNVRELVGLIKLNQELLSDDYFKVRLSSYVCKKISDEKDLKRIISWKEIIDMLELRSARNVMISGINMIISKEIPRYGLEQIYEVYNLLENQSLLTEKHLISFSIVTKKMLRLYKIEGNIIADDMIRKLYSNSEKYPIIRSIIGEFTQLMKYYSKSPNFISSSLIRFENLNIQESESIINEFKYMDKLNFSEYFLKTKNIKKEITNNQICLKISTEEILKTLSSELETRRKNKWFLTFSQFDKIIEVYNKICLILKEKKLDPRHLTADNFIITREKKVKIYRLNIYGGEKTPGRDFISDLIYLAEKSDIAPLTRREFECKENK